MCIRDSQYPYRYNLESLQIRSLQSCMACMHCIHDITFCLISDFLTASTLDFQLVVQCGFLRSERLLIHAIVRRRSCGIRKNDEKRAWMEINWLLWWMGCK